MRFRIHRYVAAPLHISGYKSFEIDFQEGKLRNERSSTILVPETHYCSALYFQGTNIGFSDQTPVISLRVWIYLNSWELYGKDRSNRANLYEKIRESICKESTSPSEQKSANSRIGRPRSPLSCGRVRISHFK
jgi:hypothetical protein